MVWGFQRLFQIENSHNIWNPARKVRFSGLAYLCIISYLSIYLSLSFHLSIYFSIFVSIRLSLYYLLYLQICVLSTYLPHPSTPLSICVYVCMCVCCLQMLLKLVPSRYVNLITYLKKQIHRQAEKKKKLFNLRHGNAMEVDKVSRSMHCMCTVYICVYLTYWLLNMPLPMLPLTCGLLAYFIFPLLHNTYVHISIRNQPHQITSLLACNLALIVCVYMCMCVCKRIYISISCMYVHV